MNTGSISKTVLLFMVAVLLCSVTGRLPASELVDTSRSEFATVQSVGLAEVRWTEGFWSDRFTTCRTKSIPSMWEIMKGTQYKPFLKHFLIAAGKAEGGYHGAKWNDGDFYKFLEACTATLASYPDPELAQIVEESIEAIGEAQREDGYIHTPVLVSQRNGDQEARPFQDRHNFEMYNMGHLLTAACLHHRVTGEESFLKIARKTADFLYEVFHEPTPELARNSVCPSHYMAMVELYRTTREPKYLELADTFLGMRDLIENGGDDNQDRIPFVQQRTAVGHAVRANYLYAGAADLFAETGDRDHWLPLQPIWNNMVRKKMHVTGGCGALYDGASPYGFKRQEQITRVHQAYGHNYELPNATAHNETCAAIGNALWNWRMFLITGEARYVDVLELALYNGVLSGVSLEGTDYFYVNPLRKVDPMPTELRFSRNRVPFITSFCCPPNVVRTIAEVNGYAYSKSDDALWLNLYGGNTLDTTLMGKPLRLTQETRYPWDGEIQVTIEESPSKEFSIQFRIPGWAEGGELSVNDEPVEQDLEPGTYAQVRRSWEAGDRITLHLPMPAVLLESHPLVEETRNQVAVKRGPVVYCLESPELPSAIDIQDVYLPEDAELQPVFDKELLGGVTRIETDLVVRETTNWDNQLYRKYQPTAETRIQSSLVPYYSWSNRGDSEMSVWIPLN